MTTATPETNASSAVANRIANATASAAPAASLPTHTSEARREGEPQAAKPTAARARPAQMGGPRLKMAVGHQIEGFHLYWENDEEGKVEQLLAEGFDFVAPAEVGMQKATASAVVADSDIANRVSRFVGKGGDGSPLRAYLLKVPNELWAERESYRHEQADQWDEAIKAGRIGADKSMYTPKGHEINVNTKFRKQY